MRYQLFAEGITLDESEKEYVQKKMMHLDKFAGDLMDESCSCRVDVRENKVKTSNQHVTIQVTIVLPKVVVRAEENGTTVQEAVDFVENKLQRQIEKYHTKKHRRSQTGDWIPQSTLEELSSAQSDLPSDLGKIIKRKRFADIEEMHEEEAVLQLELIGHDFFLFQNKDTGLLSLVYRRKDGSFGIIEVAKLDLKKW